MKKILIILSLIAVMLFSFVACKEQELTPDDLRFNKDGNFRILQLADLQFYQNGLNEKNVKLLDTLIENAKPDFIILTGDNTASEYFFEDSIENSDNLNKNNLYKLVKDTANYFTSKKIAWTAIFGNHDGLTPSLKGSSSRKVDIYNLYMESPYFVGSTESTDNYDIYREIDDTTGTDVVANFSIPIKDVKGKKVKYRMLGFDMRSEFHEYLPVTQGQIDFYNSTTAKLKNFNNGVTVPTALFYHSAIDLMKQMYDASKAKNTTKYEAIAGEINESDVSTVKGNEILDNAILANNDIVGAFFGHDHLNTFAGIYKPTENYKILMAYGRLSSYDKYVYPSLKDNFVRGGRVIDLKVTGGMETFDAQLHYDSALNNFTYYAEDKIVFNK